MSPVSARMQRSVNSIAVRCLAATPFSFPTSIIRIRRMCQDPRCSVHLLARMLGADPMLAAAVLGRAAVGSLREPFTIDDAIAKLGLAGVQGITLEVNPVPQELGAVLAEHWTRATACADLTRRLGAICGTDFPERHSPSALHQAGLMHDLGAIIGVICFGREYAKAETMPVTSADAFAEHFKQTLGVGLHSLGALVAKAWQLPRPIQSVNRWRPAPALAKQDAVLVHVVHLARILTHACGFTAGNDCYVPTIGPDILHHLRLSQRDVLHCLDEFLAALDELPQYEG